MCHRNRHSPDTLPISPRDGDRLIISKDTEIIVRRMKLCGSKKRFVLVVDPKAVRHQHGSDIDNN